MLILCLAQSWRHQRLASCCRNYVAGINLVSLSAPWDRAIVRGSRRCRSVPEVRLLLDLLLLYRRSLRLGAGRGGHRSPGPQQPGQSEWDISVEQLQHLRESGVPFRPFDDFFEVLDHLRGPLATAA